MLIGTIAHEFSLTSWYGMMDIFWSEGLMAYGNRLDAMGDFHFHNFDISLQDYPKSSVIMHSQSPFSVSF